MFGWFKRKKPQAITIDAGPHLEMTVDGKTFIIDVLSHVDAMLEIDIKHGIDEAVPIDQQSFAFLDDVATYVSKTFNVKCNRTAAYNFYAHVGDAWESILEHRKKKRMQLQKLGTFSESMPRNGQQINWPNGGRD